MVSCLGLAAVLPDPAWARLLAWLILLTAMASCLGLVVLIAGLDRVFRRAPQLAPWLGPAPLAVDQAVAAVTDGVSGAGAVDRVTAGGADGAGGIGPGPGISSSASRSPGPEPATTSLTVVLPAYNEEANIEACLSHLLASEPPCRHWRVLLVDDRSSDATAALAHACVRRLGAPAGRFSLLDAGPRPAQERWVGKNWACSRAMEQVDSDWVLFLDADVRLSPGCLRRALAQAIADAADLLSLAPRLHCSCLAEWMVQPIMASLLGLGFPIEAANDPADPTAFAAGPFMLFRRSAYLAIGGHRELAAEVVEDLALARRIKAAGLRLRYLLGLDALELHMYRDFAGLWEGWSKNWLLGLDGSVIKALGAAQVVVLLFSGPWLLAPAAAISAVWLPDQRLLLGSGLALALLGIALQLLLRLWTRRRFQVPLTLWWLMGAGGLVVGALGPTSVWRTLTGRGWTWKGRSLA